MLLNRNWGSTVYTVYSDAFTAGGGQYTARADSTTGATTSGAGSFNTSGTTGYIGDEVNGTEKWDGTISEVIVFSTALTTTQRRTIEEYLARKWSGQITPGAPTGVTATAGSTTASVSWTAPWNGGSAVTGYTVISSPGSRSCTTTGATSCTVTGLTNGTSYTFTVTATNAIGSGAASAASNSVTPN